MMNTTAKFGPVTVYFGEKNGKYPDGNQVVVTGSESKVIFDTPLHANRIVNTLNDADGIVLGHVHEDHTCGLHVLPDIPVYAPAQDIEAVRSLEGMLDHYGYGPETRQAMRPKMTEAFYFAPRPDAQPYEDGACWDLGGCTVRAIHAPGHTRGHSILMVEPAKIAFIGDIDLSSFGPYYGDGCSILMAFITTLEQLETLEATVWITFHHKGVITDQGQFRQLLSAFRDKIQQREDAIVTQLQQRPMRLDEMVAQRLLYPPNYHNVFVDDAERYTITEHLNKLLAEHRLQVVDGYYQIR